MTDDGDQKIVEIVSDAPGQLTDCIHFLGLKELLFKHFLSR